MNLGNQDITTIRNIKEIFNDIANRHYQIENFGWGKNAEIGASELTYPILWVTPTNALMVRSQANDRYTSLQIIFSVKVLDLVKKDVENQVDVTSDTFQILTDVINEFNDHPFYQYKNMQLIDDISFDEEEEFSDDETYGWTSNVTIKLRNITSWCGIPAQALESYNNVTPNGFTATTSSTLTCDTLSGCSTFSVLENRVTVLEGDTAHTANYYTTAATLNGTVISYDRTDLLSAYTVDLSSLSGGSSGSLWSASTGTNSIVSVNQVHLASGINSFVGGGLSNSATTHYSSVVGGRLNIASGTYSSIVGGKSNSSTNICSSVVGGYGNLSSGNKSSVIGGRLNISSGSHSLIGGGLSNSATTIYSAIIGGKENLASGFGSFIGGGGYYAGYNGYGNIASGQDSGIIGGAKILANGQHSFVGGGYSNSATTLNSSIIGGNNNLANGQTSSIVGGFNNLASGNASFIAGGFSNIVNSTASAIIGGSTNIIDGGESFIGGGSNNFITNNKSAIIGGQYNSATTLNSGVFIGRDNLSSGYYSSVIGGRSNLASGQSSSIIGGENNLASATASVVIGGNTNLASGLRSVVIGGQNITGATDDTVYVPKLNIGTAWTGTSVYNLGIDNVGNVMKNNLFFIGVNFEASGITWNYIAPQSFKINSIDNPSGMTYTTLVNSVVYTLGNTINLYDTLQISGATSTGLLKLNSELI